MKNTGFQILPAVLLLTIAGCNDRDRCDGPLPSSIQGNDAIILALRDQAGIALDSCLVVQFQHLLDAARMAQPEVLANIHAWPAFVLYDVLLAATGEVSAALGDGSLRTGIAELDNLLAEYQLVNVRLITSSQRGELYKLTFEEPIHAPRLAAAISELSIADISLVSQNGILGDGDDIVARQVHRDWIITFIEGEGDCPSGCIINIKTDVVVRADGSARLLSGRR